MTITSKSALCDTSAPFPPLSERSISRSGKLDPEKPRQQVRTKTISAAKAASLK
jgi:hypothetical protein